MKFTVIRLVMALTWITIAYKWGDVKNWRRYYPTMLFFGFGDLIYNVVFDDNLLWRFETDFLVGPINELFVIFTIFFSTTLLYLSNWPKKLYNQIIYILFWIIIYMIIELITTSLGMQRNYNGWNLWWSLLHNFVQFPLLILHHKNPILAWIIAFAFLFFVTSSFNVPLIIRR